MTSDLALLAAGVYAGITASVLNVIHSAQSEPYMDEVFHVPQAQSYCYGKFKEWDDKITTPPGLYVISIGILNPISHLAGRILCETIHLRLLNVLFGCLTCLIMQRISVQIHGAKHFYDGGKSVMSAFNLSVFPLLYFFNFFYYTDVGSTFMVLLTYCLHLDRRDWLAGLVGALAVLFRQTNVIWVAFVAVQAIGPHLLYVIHLSQTERGSKFSLTTKGQSLEVISGLFRLAFQERGRAVELIKVAFRVAGSYIFVCFGFVAFVWFNNGVVLGDRSAHVTTFHPMQIFYFCAFALTFSSSLVVTRARCLAFKRFCLKHWCFTILVFICMGFFIDGYTMAHPYLRADNRHYTFYIWRRIITKYKFLLLPVYVFSGFCILNSLKHTNIIFKMSFPIFTSFSIAPQLLLEFRYFIIPYLMFRLQVRPVSWLRLALELATYSAVNFITIIIFISKPFEWPQEPGKVQRFSW